MRWQAAPAGHYTWADYDGDFVLFHRPSGQTHFVNAATVILLSEVLREARDLEEAAGDLAAAQQAGVGPDFAPRVLGLLLRLEELGLVERIAS